MSVFHRDHWRAFLEVALGLFLMSLGVYLMEPAQPSMFLAALGGGLYTIGVLYFRDIVVNNVKRFLT
jgi:hypothetical protein